MFELSIIVKWIHLCCASVLVGGIIVLAWVLLPAMQESALPAKVVRIVKIMVHSSLGLLLLTGLYNVWTISTQTAVWHSPDYQGMLGAKILLYIIAFAIAIVSFRGAPDLASPRSKANLSWLAVLGVIILLLSGILNLLRFQIMTR